jgi:hypothetical protein
MLEVTMTKIEVLNSQLVQIKSEFEAIAKLLRQSTAADLLDNAVASLDDVIRLAYQATEAD